MKLRVALLIFGWCGFPPSSLSGGAPLVCVAFPFLFGVVLFSFLGWCCSLFVPIWVVFLFSLSLLLLGVACFVILFLVGGAAFPSSFLVVLPIPLVVVLPLSLGIKQCLSEMN